MGSIHVPRLTGRRRPGPRIGRRARMGVALALLGAMALVAGAHHAASAATDAPYGGTAAAVPGTVYAANYDTGGQGVAYNVSAANGSANGYRTDGIDLEATADTQNNTGAGPTTSAGPPPGSGSSTPSTPPPRAPTRSASGSPRPTGSPTRCTSTTRRAPTSAAPSPSRTPAGTRPGPRSPPASR